MVKVTSDVSTNIFDSSHSKYSLLTLTLSGPPTTNFCIGEVLTCDSQFLRVQDYTSGGTTVVVYRVTSQQMLHHHQIVDQPLLVFNCRFCFCTSSVTTHGSTTGSFVQKSVSVTSIRWSVSTGHSYKNYSIKVEPQSRYLLSNRRWSLGFNKSLYTSRNEPR